MLDAPTPSASGTVHNGAACLYLFPAAAVPHRPPLIFGDEIDALDQGPRRRAAGGPAARWIASSPRQHVIPQESCCSLFRDEHRTHTVQVACTPDLKDDERAHRIAVDARTASAGRPGARYGFMTCWSCMPNFASFARRLFLG